MVVDRCARYRAAPSGARRAGRSSLPTGGSGARRRFGELVAANGIARRRLAHQHMRRLHRDCPASARRARRPAPAARISRASSAGCSRQPLEHGIGEDHVDRLGRRPGRRIGQLERDPGQPLPRLLDHVGRGVEAAHLAPRGQRATSSSVELPGPQPMSTTRRGFPAAPAPADRAPAAYARPRISDTGRRTSRRDLAPWIAQSSIHLATIADLDDQNDQHLILNLHDYAKVSDTETPELLTTAVRRFASSRGFSCSAAPRRRKSAIRH